MFFLKHPWEFNIDVFFVSLVYSWIVFFPPFSPFSILGPLTKKQTDDLGDNDGAEDEGIFLPPNWFAWQGSLKIFFLPSFFDFLSSFEELSFF